MKRNVLKWVLYALFLVLLYAIQSSLGDRLTVLGIKPDLVPFYVCAVAVHEKKYGGAWFGFFAGLIADAFHPISTGFFPVLYFGCGYAVGFLTDRYFSPNLVTAALFGAVASLVSNGLQYVVFYMIFERAAVTDLGFIAGVEGAWSLALSPFAYLPTALCRRLTEDRRADRKKLKKRYN